MPAYNKDRYFMNLASDIASDLTSFGGAKIASVLVHKNQIISIGHNKQKTHPFAARFAKNPDSIYFHAEVNAIHNALRRHSEEELIKMKTTLYICRVKFDHANATNLIWGMSKPCCGCDEAIEYFKINKVVYSLNEDDTLDKQYAIKFH